MHNGSTNKLFDPNTAKKWSAEARAFNRGADARLAGLSIQACPHPEGTLSYKEWRHGWLHTHQYWGKDARWPVAPLPEVTPCP